MTIIFFISINFFRRKGISGKLLYNDQPRDETNFRKKSCLIMQDDNLQPLLTVKEAMFIAARLKLPGLTQNDHFTRVS